MLQDWADSRIPSTLSSPVDNTYKLGEPHSNTVNRTETPESAR